MEATKKYIYSNNTEGLAKVLKEITPELEEIRSKIMKSNTEPREEKHNALCSPCQDKPQIKSFKPNEMRKTVYNTKLETVPNELRRKVPLSQFQQDKEN